MTIFWTFWLWDPCPICIHGSRMLSSTCMAKPCTSDVADIIFSQGGLIWRTQAYVKIVKFALLASKSMFYFPVDPDRVISNHHDSNHNGSCQLTVCWVDFADSISISTDFIPPLLTHWGRVTHICISKLTIIGLDNGLSPGRRQAIIWTKPWILLNWT